MGDGIITRRPAKNNLHWRHIGLAHIGVGVIRLSRPDCIVSDRGFLGGFIKIIHHVQSPYRAVAGKLPLQDNILDVFSGIVPYYQRAAVDVHRS